MRIGAILGNLVMATVALLTLAASASAAAPPDPVAARLIPEAKSIAPGQTLWVDLHFDIAAGWHTYWRNPGDSGLPTEIAWKLPAGFTAGEAAWPVPERFVLGTIGNYGYSGSADLLVPITAPADLKRGDAAHLAGDATWLVCSDICIPGEAHLALDLPVGAAPSSPDPAVAAIFAAARRHLPQRAPFTAHFATLGGRLRLTIPHAALVGLDNPAASFFPTVANLVDAAGEPQQTTTENGLVLSLPRLKGAAASHPPPVLDGVLLLHGKSGGERVFSIAAAPAAAPADGGNPAIAWWQALLLAALGGIVLNLMPCVFPILSLKLLGLAGAATQERQWHHALAYAGGVVLSFALLGGVLLTLRAGGAAIGWGFQLQSPVVVGLLAYLLFAMGLSLSGVADFGIGLADFGGRFAHRAGLFGAFATGVLATVVATPCTAPFMGAALGFALIAPAPLALAIFIALGAGLALPFAIAAAIPAVARAMPRPGVWMLWCKQLLAFPLYGTVAWLIWVLLQETAPGGAFAALLGLVVVGFAVWIYGRTRFAAAAGRRLGAGLAAAAVAASLILAARLTPAAAPAIGSADAARGGLGYEAFSPDRLARLAAEHQPVFVNLTAAWCITCLFNERTVLDSEAVRDAFARRHVVLLKGDWTRRDPAIAVFLQRFGRSGVPLYLLYDKAGTPTVLPQILTEASVLDAVGKI
jgi:thiol:disulfide interchange protein DsbD